MRMNRSPSLWVLLLMLPGCGEVPPKVFDRHGRDAEAQAEHAEDILLALGEAVDRPFVTPGAVPPDLPPGLRVDARGHLVGAPIALGVWGSGRQIKVAGERHIAASLHIEGPHAQAEWDAPDTIVPSRGLTVRLPLAWRTCPAVDARLTSPSGAVFALTHDADDDVWRSEDHLTEPMIGRWRLSVSADCPTLTSTHSAATLAYTNALQISAGTERLLVLDDRAVDLEVHGALGPARLTLEPEVHDFYALDGAALGVDPQMQPGVYRAVLTAQAGPETAQLALPIWKPETSAVIATDVQITPFSALRRIVPAAEAPPTEFVLCLTLAPESALPTVAVGRSGAMIRLARPQWWRTRHGECVLASPPAGGASWQIELRAPRGQRITIHRLLELRGAPLQVRPDARSVCLVNTDCEVAIQASGATGAVRYAPLVDNGFGAMSGGLRGRARVAGIHPMAIVARDAAGQARVATLDLPILEDQQRGSTPVEMSDAGAAVLAFDIDADRPGSAGRVAISIDHPRPCRLRISLESPSGHRRLLRDRCPLGVAESHFVADDLLTGAPGDRLAGRWRVIVEDLERDGERGAVREATLGWMDVLSTGIAAPLPPATVGEPYRVDLPRLNASDATICALHGPLPAGLEFDAAACTVTGTPTATEGGGAMLLELVDPERAATEVTPIELPVLDWRVEGAAVRALPGASAEGEIELDPAQAGHERLLFLDLEADWLPFVAVELCTRTLCQPIKPLGSHPGYVLQGWFAIPAQLDGARYRLRLQAPEGGSARLRRWMLGGRRALRIRSVELPWARAGHEYTASLQTADAQGDVLWRIVDGALPAGLALRADGTIFGRARFSGVFRPRVEAQDEAGRIATATVELRIAATEARDDDHHAIPDDAELTGGFGPDDLVHFCIADADFGEPNPACAIIELETAAADVVAGQLALTWSHGAPLDVWAYLETPSRQVIPLLDGRGPVAGAFTTRVCNTVATQARLADALIGGACEADTLGDVFSDALQVLASQATIEACCALRDDVPDEALREALRGQCCTHLPELIGEPAGRWRLILIDVHPGESGAVSSARLTLFDTNPAE